jgi:hypothetical protein
VTTSPRMFTIGDRVVCDPAQTAAKYHGIIWTVEQFHRVNVDIRSLDKTRRLRIPPSALLPAPAAGTTATVTIVPYLPTLSAGAVVTVASPRWKGGDRLFVVLADNIDTVQLAVLGGDQYRIWPNVPRSWITEIDRTALLTAVAGLRTPA